MNLAAVWHAIGYSGCLGGRAHILEAALNCIFLRSRSMGGKSA